MEGLRTFPWVSRFVKVPSEDSGMRYRDYWLIIYRQKKFNYIFFNFNAHVALFPGGKKAGDYRAIIICGLVLVGWWFSQSHAENIDR